MAVLDELRAAIHHISACTGDRDAWRRDLSSADLAVVSASVVDPGAAGDLLAKIKANHPRLFDARTGAPVTPAGQQGQSGVGADAMKAAEDALVRQNSRTAEVDLQVITAIANAHSETERGNQRLRELQRDIEGAVRNRTDLDTAAGARDFQRYLIGKLREIGAVIETAGLDSSSKAALVSAWTALYRSADVPESTQASASPEPAVLPAYGIEAADFDSPVEPGHPAGETAPMAASSPPPHPTPALGLPPAAGGVPPFALPPAAPPWSGLSAPAPEPGPELLRNNRLPTDHGTHRSARDHDRELDQLLDALFSEPAEEPGSAERPADSAERAAPDAALLPDPGAATRVALPDGSVVSAPTVALANVMRAALTGTPIPEAFGAQGITVPPPGTAIGLPVDPSRVVAGDVGMFMEHQALALDAQRAWLHGRVQPVGAVTGPSFLGWLHPPAPSAPADGAPLPNSPAAAPGTAR